MDILERFKKNISNQKLFDPSDHLLLAVSGGVDSVALVELCKKAHYRFSIAHCNFQLRGDESTRDEVFVAELASKYKVTLFSRKFETEKWAADNNVSIQVAARELRYQWFDSIINEPDAGAPRYILTAHHADDNAETVLMNFTRGTGLHGLTGIPVKNGKIRRPLLSFYKEELIDFAKVNQLSFVEDSSNASTKYSRNLIRNELIPTLQQIYPQVSQNLVSNIERFREIENLYKLATGRLLEKLIRRKGKEIHVPVKQLMSYNNTALIFELIAPYGFSERQVEEVIKLSASETGRYIISPDQTHRIIRHRHWFIISPMATGSSSHILIEGIIDKVDFAGGSLQLKLFERDLPSLKNTVNVAQLDLNALQFPLLLRQWKEGDYFYPLGMKKKKKIARFLIDQKLSKTDKEKIWVLESGKKIVWVVGYRIDDRFRITEKTRSLLQITAIHD